MSGQGLPEVTGDCHPACEVLPRLERVEYNALHTDIRDHGQRVPIIVDETGLILDGRNRWSIVRSLQRGPVIERFSGTEAEKIALVISLNVRRRHLTDQQRAAIAAELSNMQRGGDRRSENFKPPIGGVSVTQAAELL